jgi:hypothetical protein
METMKAMKAMEAKLTGRFLHLHLKQELEAMEKTETQLEKRHLQQAKRHLKSKLELGHTRVKPDLKLERVVHKQNLQGLQSFRRPCQPHSGRTRGAFVRQYLC